MTEQIEATQKSLETVIVSFADKLEAFAVKHSGEAWELALMAARIDAGTILVYGLISFLGIFIFTLLSWQMYKIADRTDCELCRMICFISAIIACISLIAMCINWFNLWAWFGVFEPKLWLAYKVLGL